jgi:hypothetical protein
MSPNAWLGIGKGRDKYELPLGAHIIVNRNLKSNKLDHIPISDSELLTLIAIGSKYLAEKLKAENPPDEQKSNLLGTLNPDSH